MKLFSNDTLAYSAASKSYLKYPGERELWMYERHNLQKHFDSPYIATVPVSEIDVLSFDGYLLSFVGLRLEHLRQASSCHRFWIEPSKEFGGRATKILFK